MPIFYRGAGLHTHWHQHDARLTGFTPHHAGAGLGLSRILHHIARGTTASPYISLTRSYAVARHYALCGQQLPTAANPAYVYEIDQHDGLGTQLLDPIVALAPQLGTPYDARSYHHDGDPRFILGVADSKGQATHLNQTVRFAPPATGTPRTPLLTIELERLVRALRDSEVLAFGAVASTQIKRRINVH